MIEKLTPDILYNATGSKSMTPPIEGLLEYTDATDSKITSITNFMETISYFEKIAEGKKVVIIGAGAVGLDVMEFFALRKADVQVIEMMPSVGKDCDIVTKSTLKNLFKQHDNIHMHLATALKKVCPDKFIAEHDRKMEEYPFDLGFICMGLIPDLPDVTAFEAYARKNNIPYYNIGNSNKTGQIIHGTEAGRNVVNVIDMIGGFED
jgi:pyruvate/2-oxoglutarate dehydrogenase complex dihydrolipoamide dehydrogenase (E3) component